MRTIPKNIAITSKITSIQQSLDPPTSSQNSERVSIKREEMNEIQRELNEINQVPGSFTWLSLLALINE